VSGSSITVRPSTAADVPVVRPLWDALYRHQQAHGLVARLADDGFDRWVNSLAGVLGRFACLFIADAGKEAIGFLAGRIRVPTPPFGVDPVGFISEVFVGDAYRGSGVGRTLLRAAEEWFVGQSVRRLELQVLCDNTAARAAYQRIGWRDELVQMVYTVGNRQARD
jgi:ribosomal protein S18 acetylase RimI-like enzyme